MYTHLLGQEALKVYHTTKRTTQKSYRAYMGGLRLRSLPIWASDQQAEEGASKKLLESV